MIDNRKSPSCPIGIRIEKGATRYGGQVGNKGGESLYSLARNVQRAQ